MTEGMGDGLVAVGGERLMGSWLIDLGARMYDPGLGQYLSPDPLAGGDPYVYVRDNPLSRIDPLGLSSCFTGAKPTEADGSGGVTCLQKIVVTGSMSELLAQDLAMWNAIQALDSALQVPASSWGFNVPGVQTPQKKSQSKQCGSSQGIPAGETLSSAHPYSEILTSGAHSIVVSGNGSQVQVALTNDFFVPALAVTYVSFQAVGDPTLNLGASGADILFHTTSTFRSDMFGVLGGALYMKVNINIMNDGALETAYFCIASANGG